MVADIFLNEANPFYWLIIFVIFVLAVSILVYILFELGAFGGADAKAIICLVVLVPEFVFSTFLYACLLAGVLLIVPLIRREGWAAIKNYKAPFMPALAVGLFLSIIYGNTIMEVIL
ncbi:MAG: hypothetical protein JRC90_10110 [Deltaproteobacteria bacterium]|nr:hypothetical protein [Deltaproteobacteria bacterium]